MKAEASSVFGNYRWSASGEIADSLIAVLLPFAITQVLQRSPSSNAEKEIAGYEKRPEGFKRNSLPFDKEGAAVLKKHLENAEITIGEGDEKKSFKLPLEISVEEYTGSAVEAKFTEEKAIVKRHQDAGDLEDWLAEKVKFAGDSEDEQAVLVAVREFKKAALKGL
jgi:hypothetical protein